MRPDQDYRHPVSVSSPLGHARIELGVAPAPPQSREMLPGRYGVPLFEFLCVDPANVFVSWEITPRQLEECRAAIGDAAFGERHLQVEVFDGQESVCRRELFGEVGRWFLPLAHNGFRATARLGFSYPAGFYELASAGPLSIPRTFVVDCTKYEELSVDYGTGRTGELILAGINADPTASWPAISLPAPDSNLINELQQVTGTESQPGHNGWPGSPQGRPTSPGRRPTSPGLRPTSPGWGKANGTNSGQGATYD